MDVLPSTPSPWSPPAEPARPARGGVLATVGRTPLVRLDRVLRPRSWALYAKLEGQNPGGSAKDRAALRILEDALASGELRPGATVVESSSGNMGVGLAQACAYHDLRFHCVVDPHTTEQNIRLMRAYGARVEVVRERCPETKSYLPTRLRRIQEILREEPGSFWVNQYENASGVASHYDTTAPEIVEELGDFPDYFFCAVGTCATIQGCASFFRDQRARTKIVGVDSVGSTVLGGEAAPRKIPGIGSVMAPALLDRSLIDVAVKVSEDDAIRWCKAMAQTEAVLVGGSAGAVMCAVAQLQDQIPPGATAAALLPDRGERYLDLIFDDAGGEDGRG